MDIYNRDVVKKWEQVLDHKDYKPIEDHTRRWATAQILENANQLAGLATQRRQYLQAGGSASLLEAWGAIDGALEYGRLPSQQMIAEATPTNVMGASAASTVAGAGNIDIYDPVMVGMLRRTMPNLMGFDFMGVQPMNAPVGVVFTLRGYEEGPSKAGLEDRELFYKEANIAFTATASGNAAHQSSNSEFVSPIVGTSPDQLYTNDASYTSQGGFSTAFAEMLGSDDGNAFQEIGITVDKIAVIAKGRAVAASYSNELAQDLMQIHGIAAETQLSTMAVNKIMFDINRELIRKVYITSKIGAQNCQTAGIFNLDVDADGRWLAEKILGLYMQMEFEANEIAKDTRFGKGNGIITTSNVAAALNAAKYLKYTNAEIAGKLTVDDTGQTFVGVLNNGMRVYIDPYHSTTSNKHFVDVFYKGKDAWEAGMYYCPYMPIQYMKAIEPKSFQPRLGFKTRYGLIASPFANGTSDGAIDVTKKNRFYRLMVVTNLL